MAHRADATYPGSDSGHLRIRPAFTELLKSTKFRNVKSSFAHLIIVVQVNGDLGMTFDSRHRINDNSLSHTVHYSLLNRISVACLAALGLGPRLAIRVRGES